MRFVFIALGLLLTFLNGRMADAGTSTFALVIGNNEAPQGQPELSTLKYADDDAIRFFNFVQRIGDDAILLTMPDKQTQKRYPSIALVSKAPTVEKLEEAIVTLQQKIAAAKSKGNKTVVFVFFSGHGAYDQTGNPYLALLDGKITSKILYENILANLKTDYQHLLVDSCYAGGVAFSRGMFDNEIDAKHVNFSVDKLDGISGKNRRRDFPGLGVMVAASGETRSHEWSKIGAGVFTHEVLSGLSGPADINLDGKIEYSELAAFVAAANSRVENTRGKISVRAMPPSSNQNAPMVKLSSLKNVAFLYGNPSKLGHFFIETKSGERYLDANLSNAKLMHIALPAGDTMYLHANKKEAKLAPGKTHVALNSLSFNQSPMSKKGGLEQALQKGLFAAPFTDGYYSGYVDSTAANSVDFQSPQMAFNNQAVFVAPITSTKSYKKSSLPPATPMLSLTDTSAPKRWRKPTAITSFILAGSFAAASAVLGGLSKKKKDEFDEEDRYNASMSLNTKYKRLGTSSWIFGATACVALVIGAIVWPKHNKKTSSKKRVALDATSLEIRF